MKIRLETHKTVVYCEFIDLFKVFVVNWSESESLLSPSTSEQGHERELNQIYNKWITKSVNWSTNKEGGKYKKDKCWQSKMSPTAGQKENSYVKKSQLNELNVNIKSRYWLVLYLLQGLWCDKIKSTINESEAWSGQ